jgi:Na+/H+ antiporter NhaD/arsenite permease-like protein
MTDMLLLATAQTPVPSVLWTWPFVAILLAIAIFPLLSATHHWWEQNSSKLTVALLLGAITLGYYYFRDFGVAVHHEGDDAHAAEVEQHAAVPDESAEHPLAEAEPNQPVDANAAPEKHGAGERTAESAHSAAAGAEIHAVGEHEPEEHAEGEYADGEHAVHLSQTGWPTVMAVLDHAIIVEYIPFLTLLFALYVIAGGIVVRGDIRATPMANTIILAIGGLIASVIGTTGAAMVLIRVLLKTNSERKHIVHTVVFFIFIVANIGGTLLPIGDPPLFLGYLRGVQFFWTLNLWVVWAFTLAFLLVIYFVWDTWAYRHEEVKNIIRDDTQITPIHLGGMINFLWVFGVVFAVATLDPAKAFPGTEWHPPKYLREGVQLLMVGLSLLTTPNGVRKENQFNYVAIGEVACLFIGIFITMQVPIEILVAKGASLGLSEPWHFFWATGILSSFLDNAPTYVVFFETAASPNFPKTGEVVTLLGGGGLSEKLLYAISCGAVFMGANSYIGNGPNFMVKSIAEQSGVRMPSFFGYMAYSGAVLIPVFIVLTLIFFI